MSDSSEENGGADVKEGVAWVGTQLRKVKYSVVDGLAVVEGCIILGTAEKIEEITRIAPDADASRLEEYGVVIKGPQYRWPKNRVVYVIDPALPRPERVTAAIEHWRAKVKVLEFLERPVGKEALYPNYILFTPGNGCSSNVGCQGGQQIITLGEGCTVGNTIHEIGHAVGLWHEQSRRDRGDFVTITMAKVTPGYEHNFDQHIYDGADVGVYDYGSIMHYPRNAFSVDGSDTITPKGEHRIGQREALSAGDIKTITQIYS